MLAFSGHRLKQRFLTDIERLKERLELATRSLEEIARGSFEFAIPEHQDTADEDEKTFQDALSRAKAKLAEYAQQEAERKWISDGMNLFMKLISGHERDKATFYDEVLKFLVRYTGGNQGGIYLLNEPEDAQPFLELTACYAYGKKRFDERRIEIGQGMLGQCYLEKDTSFVTEIPSNYTRITSGLGEATPRFLIMIPMRFDEAVPGIIELAYFQKLENYRITFLEKVAETMASITINIRDARRAEALYEESQQKAKALQEREETLRQNVEELMATQEEMKRQQAELNAHSDLMKIIIDNIPFPIFVKDEKCRYTLVNKAESGLFNLTDKDLIGKDDRHFVSRDDEWKVIRASDENALYSNKPVELPLQHYTTRAGNAHIFKTTKVSFVNPVTGRKNILGVSIDLTEKLSLEKKLLNEKRITQNNTFINVSGRQRMLSQKIGFYCESLVRGKLDHAGLLRDAIELHEHSLQVLRYGGMPMGISCENPLPALPAELAPAIQKVERLWDIYKRAAENILYFFLTENKTGFHSAETEKSISVIEDHGEILLEAHNQFINAFLEVSASKLSVV